MVKNNLIIFENYKIISEGGFKLLLKFNFIKFKLIVIVINIVLLKVYVIIFKVNVNKLI